MAFDREKVVQEAQKLVTKGRLDRAIVEYQKLVKANPGDDRSWIKIAELQIRMRAYDAAVSTYEQVAAYYASQGFSAKAMAIYKQIRGLIQQHLPESKGHYGPVVDKLANLYIEAGLKGDAIATYQEYSTHLQRSGRDGELLPVYKRIVELKEDDIDARLTLIGALRKQGLEEEADAHLVAYGDRLVHLGRIDEGLVALDNVAQRRNTDAVLARKVADLYLDRNGPGDATVALMRMQACFLSTKRDIDTLRVLARAFSMIGQRAKAIEVRKLMVKIAKDNGDLEIAQALVDELLEDCPQEPGIRELAASVYPDRVISSAPPALEDDDVPEVDVAPASVSFSEESFELYDENMGDFGDELLEGVSSFPAPEPGGFGIHALPVPQPLIPRPGIVVPPPPPARPVKTLASFGPPPERRPLPPPPIAPRISKLAPPPPPPRPVRAPPPAWPSQHGVLSLPALPLDEEDGLNDFTADYDAMVGVGIGEQAKEPGSLPPPDFLQDEGEFTDEETEAMPSASGNQPSYAVDEGLEEALEEVDFFVAQGLLDDALSSLEELIPRYPGHPLLIEKMQSVRLAKS